MRSFEGALRGFFQPIKNDGPRLNFYNVYKREAAKYDMDYVKNYNDDLNATLIFVRRLPNVLDDLLTLPRRRACFLRSARPLRSMPTQNFNRIPTTNPSLSSVTPSSPSKNLRCQMQPLLRHASKNTPPLPGQCPLPPFSCLRAF